MRVRVGCVAVSKGEIVSSGKDRQRYSLQRRDFLACAGAVAATSILPGCDRLGGGTSSEEKSGSGGGTIKWAELYSVDNSAAAKANVDWLKGVAEQFEKANPGWKVEFEGFLFDQIDQRSILDLRAQVPHDLMFSSPQLMAKHEQVGDYIDLSSYIEKLDPSDVEDLSWSPVWGAATVGGGQLGVPVGIHTRTLAYNRDMFESAGLGTDPQLQTPEDMVEAAKSVTDPANDIWGVGIYMGPTRATIELSFAPLVWHYGGEFFDAGSMEATLTSDASLQAVQFLSDLVHKHKVTPPYNFAPDSTYDDVVLTDFVEGTIAQGVGFGSYWIASLEDEGLIKGCFPAAKGCSPQTAGVAVQPSQARAQFTNAWLLSIHKLSPNPDMAWKLLETALEPKNLLSFPDAGLPARLSSWSQPQYASDFYRTWFTAAKEGRSMPPTAYYPELGDAVAAGIQEVLGNRADIESTMARIEQDWNNKYAGQ